MSFIEELKRRNVFRVGLAYVLMGWVLLQGADFVLDVAGAPDWVIRTLIVVVALGLPIALFFAWAFELTPEGIKREENVDRSTSITPQTGRRLDRAIIVFLAVALALVLGERFFLAERATPPVAETAGNPEAPARPPVPAPITKSVAVLPFADMSQAGDREWFADGLAEEILNALVRVPDLQVAARTSSFQYRTTDLSIPEIAAELGVAHVLEGSVRSTGDRVRVTAQLIRSADGFHIWSQNYDRDLADMIAIQEDLARNIATALQTSMDPEALAAMARAGTQNVDAYQAFLRGLKYRQDSFNARAGEDGAFFQQAYEQFEEARRLDPGFSSAHVEAADFWKVQMSVSRTDFGLTGLAPREILAEFHERIEAAGNSARSEIDRTRILADEAEVDLRVRESLRLYQQYLAARPNDDNARTNAIGQARLARDPDAARALLAPLRERALSDQGAASGFVNTAFAVLPPAEAADFALEILERWPNQPGLLYQVHRSLLWAGRRLEASGLAARHRSITGEFDPLMEAREACAAGDREAAQEVLDRLDPQAGNFTSMTWMINSLLGNRRAQFDAVKPIEATGVPYQLAVLMFYPQFDPRPFPSVMAVLEREGIDPGEPRVEPFACPPPERTSVAVLAFENMSPDPENEYFADGISEEILNVLTGLDDLRVIARTSAFSFKGSGATVAEIAEKLDVGYVLEGSVRKAGERVRVTAQLIDTASESHLWSDTYDRNLDDIFAVQDEIARAIAAELELRLSPEQEAALASAPTDDIEAYNAYLRGRQLWHQRGENGLRTSIRVLEQAVAMDPQFAEAWAALADSYILLPEYSNDPAAPLVPKARDAVNRALELQPEMAQALTTRAYIRYLYDYDWDNAERDFQRALELAPDYPTARQWYGEMIAVRDRDIDGALEHIRQAARLDPLAPIMWHVSGWLATQDDRFEEGLAYYEKALEILPTFESTYANLSFAYAQMGEYERSKEAWQRYLELANIDWPADGLTVADALRDPTLKPAYIEFMNRNDNLFRNSTAIRGSVYMMLDEPELALEVLLAGQEEGDPYATHANRMRVYDPLREDPRFQAHLAKMNLWPPETGQ